MDLQSEERCGDGVTKRRRTYFLTYRLAIKVNTPAITPIPIRKNSSGLIDIMAPSVFVKRKGTHLLIEKGTTWLRSPAP
jgi:hypothetical protein